MKSLTRLCIIGLLVSVLALMPDSASVAEAQLGWSKVDLGSEGLDVVLDEARGVLYVSLPDARKVTVVDAASGALVRDVLLDDIPAGMDLSPDGDHLYVALLGVGSVAVIDLADDSVETVSVEAQLGAVNAIYVHVLDDSRFLVSGAGFWIVLVDQTDSSQTRVASNARPITCGPEFTGNVGEDFLYLVEGGCSPNSLYKIDLTQPSLPVIAEDNHGDIFGAEQAKVSPDGSLIYLSTQIVSTLDLTPVGTTPVRDSFPAPLGDGRVAFVADTGDKVRVVNDANQIAFTLSTSCKSEWSLSLATGVHGVNVTADSSVLYFEAGGFLCAVSLVAPPCEPETVVFDEDELNSAIDCYNAQRPQGDHTITLGASFGLTEQLHPVTLNSPATRLTIKGADNALTANGLPCCGALLALEGSSDLYVERLLVDAVGDVALAVGADAGELWVIDARIVGSVDVDGGTFVLLRSALSDIGGIVGIDATGGIVSVYRSLIVGMDSPIVSSADLLAVGYSIISGADSNIAIRVEGTQPSQVEVLGSVIFDAAQGLVLDGPNSSSLIVNSTLWANDVGVRISSGDVTVTNSTIALSADGLVVEGGVVTVTSSILTNERDCPGPLEGLNNFSQATNCGAGFTQLTNDDYSNFGTLDDHGCTPQVETPWGCTAVLSLLEGHSAIGAGECDDVRVRFDSTGQLDIDQRGLPRVPATCDAGAFETLLSTKCDGLDVTIDMNVNGGDGTGTAGDDVIVGTPGPDVIDAGAGNDTVCARGGDDVIVGGSGDDTMFGEGGRDIIRGNAGVDVIDGGAGNDRLLGGIDGDTLIGGDGDDYLGGFGGADTIIGGPGNERIFGGFGADTIDGGPGDDVISGLIGNDTINGGEGDDTLNGDRGKDTINGGPGNDTINGGNSDDNVNGGAGDDSVNGGRGDDQLSGGPDEDICVGNKENVADTADGTCELEFGIP